MNSNLSKLFKQIIIAVAVTILMTNCKTNKLLLDEKNDSGEINIYVAGYEYNDSKFESSIEEIADEVGMKHVAKLWKNGTEIHLENNELYSDVSSVSVHNNNSYVVGTVEPNDEHIAAIWKNGKIQKLTDGITTAYTRSVCTENNNIYVLGAQYDKNNYIVKVWKNAVLNSVIKSDHWIDASSMFVYKGDIFICGNERNGDEDKQRYRNNDIAKIWKNGKVQNLTDGHNNAYALSVFVNNDNVFIAGYEIVNDKCIAKLWKNGKSQNLSDNSNNSIARSIYVYNNNTYVVGSETINGVSVAKLWVNGNAESITNGKNNAYAKSVYIHKNNIYIVGIEENNKKRDVAKLWINGVAKNLTDGTKNGYANSIFVENKNK